MRGGFMAYEPDELGVTSAVGDERLQLSDVGKLLRRGQRRVVGAARADDRVTFHKLVVEHLDVDPSIVEVVQESWANYDHVNVQAGLDAWLDDPRRTHEIIGVLGARHMEFGLSELMRSRSAGPEFHGPSPGNVARVNLAAGPSGEVRPCVMCGLYLVSDGERRAVLLLRMSQPMMGQPRTTLEIAADDPALAAELAADVRQLSLQHNVYRGHVVSFENDVFGQRETVLSFQQRSAMTADELILPAETITAITRQVVGVARHRQQLLAAHQHLKRGVLLYGPPGVGKTHTVRYLTSQLTETTIVQLSGNTLHLIAQACSVARTLQPAMIIVEDVDLIAEERGMHSGEQPLLFQLLNEMDGLAEDADVVFLLTTNRADLLEPALAQRPGRVDQAVAIALPDAEGRRRLFALYRGNLEIDESRLESVIARTDGVTASFLKELLRRAAVVAADQGGDGAGDGRAGVREPTEPPLRVSAEQLDSALDELLDTSNAMTRVLLGGQAPAGA